MPEGNAKRTSWGRIAWLTSLLAATPTAVVGLNYLVDWAVLWRSLEKVAIEYQDPDTVPTWEAMKRMHKERTIEKLTLRVQALEGRVKTLETMR